MKVLKLAILMTLISSPALSQDTCPEGSITLGGETAEDPIVINQPCTTVCWDPPSTGTVHHYHVRIDGVQTSSPTENFSSVCMPTQDQSYGITVGASGLLPGSDSPPSDTTFIMWKDLICEELVEVEPVDGVCPPGSTPQ